MIVKVKLVCLFFRLGYRCLRAVGFLSGLAAGAGFIFWLQNKEVTILGSPADSGKSQTVNSFRP